MAEFDPRQTDLAAFGKAVEQQLARWTDEEGEYSTDDGDWWMDLWDWMEKAGESPMGPRKRELLLKLATCTAVLWSVTKEGVECHEL
jgi:hypothetical protein